MIARLRVLQAEARAGGMADRSRQTRSWTRCVVGMYGAVHARAFGFGSGGCGESMTRDRAGQEKRNQRRRAKRRLTKAAMKSAGVGYFLGVDLAVGGYDGMGRRRSEVLEFAGRFGLVWCLLWGRDCLDAASAEARGAGDPMTAQTVTSWVSSLGLVRYTLNTVQGRRDGGTDGRQP